MTISDPDSTTANLPPDIFEVPDVWAAYRADVQARLRHKAEERRAFWQVALAQAEALLVDAQAIGDSDVVAELQTAASGFRARLGTVPENVLPVAAPERVDAEPEAVAKQEPTPSPPPLLDSEAEAKKHARVQAFIGEINELESAWAALEAKGFADANREWNRPQLFHLRSLACALGNIYARAHRQDAAVLVRPAAVRLRERMQAARHKVGERSDVVAFDEAFWLVAECRLWPETWHEFSLRYYDMAEAQAAWEWFLPHEDALSRQTRHDLLNALLAVQQGLCLRLEKLWGRDRLQTDLFYEIRNRAQDAGFLSAISSDTSLTTLGEIGAELMVLWKDAQTEAAAWEETQAKANRKKEAVEAVVAVLTQAGTAIPSPNDVLPLLDECAACGVPPTNAPVRNALLRHGPILLAGQARFAKLLEAVRAERQRQNMDEINGGVPTPKALGTAGDDDEDAALGIGEQDAVARAIGPWLRNRKLLILGGIPRQRTCDELKRACGCAEVHWPHSTDTDTAAKFKSDIQKSDVLLLLKNFARHDMSKRGRDWVTENGGHFVFITGGYGVRQIIHQLSEYALLNKLLEPAASPAA